MIKEDCNVLSLEINSILKAFFNIFTNCIYQVLIRRAKIADILPGNYKVNRGQDIMISVYNIHRSSQVRLSEHKFEKRVDFCEKNIY